MWSRMPDVLHQVVGELLLVEPGRLPVVDVADPQSFRMNLLAHGGYLPFAVVVSSMVMWLVRFLMRRGAPERARPVALDRGALVDEGLDDPQLVRRRARRPDSALATAEFSSFRMSSATARGAWREDRARLLDLLAADVVHHEARLARRAAHVARAGAHDDARRRGGAARRLRSPVEVSAEPRRRRAGCAAASSAGLGGLAPRRRGLGRLGVGRRLGARRRSSSRAISSAFLPVLGRPRASSSLLELVDLERLPAALGWLSHPVGVIASSPGRCRRARGTRAWARTRRACGRPSTRRRTPGTCLRPSWTAIVCPTISGKITDVRDQVLTICRSPEAFMRLDAPAAGAPG